MWANECSKIKENKINDLFEKLRLEKDISYKELYDKLIELKSATDMIEKYFNKTVDENIELSYKNDLWKSKEKQE